MGEWTGWGPGGVAETHRQWGGMGRGEDYVFMCVCVYGVSLSFSLWLPLWCMCLFIRSSSSL